MTSAPLYLPLIGDKSKAKIGHWFRPSCPFRDDDSRLYSFFFFSAQHNTNNNKNNKYNIHIHFWEKEIIGNIKKITFPVKRIRPWRWKTLEDGGLHSAITTHGSKLVGGGRMNENAIHGGPKKGLRMENCTKQSLRMAPNSKVEDAWTKTQFMGLRKRGENGELQ